MYLFRPTKVITTHKYLYFDMAICQIIILILNINVYAQVSQGDSII